MEKSGYLLYVLSVIKVMYVYQGASKNMECLSLILALLPSERLRDFSSVEDSLAPDI